MSLTLCAGGGVLAAQSPSVLVPSTRADQLPVTPGYRRQVLEPTLRPAALAPSTQPFRLLDVQVQGSSLSPALLQRAYGPWLGRMVGETDLKAVADAVAGVYAAHSDVALYGVLIPAQSFQDGRARIEVAEGFIQGVRVTAPAGSRRSNALLKHYLARLVAEHPLRRSSLERYSALIRDIAGLDATLDFAPGTRPGGQVLVVSTRPRTAELGFGVNNRGTAFLGRTQVDVDLALHSLLRQGDDTHLTVAFPTDLDRFRYYGLSHAQPLGASGASVLASAGYLQTRPSFADLHGHALTLGVSATAPVLRRNAQSVYLTAGLDGVDSDNALLGQEISNDRIRTLRVGASYIRQNTRVFLLLNGSANFGLDGLGAHVLSPEISDVRFSKYTVKMNVNTALTDDLVLRLDGAGQYTTDRLPGSEQLALGGDEFGRAYEAAIIAGDQGVAGSAELAWKLARIVPASLRASEVYAFADGGETRRLTRPAAPEALQQLASLGGGARIAVTGRAVVQIEADRGLLDPIATEDHESWRGVFSIRSSF
ncbi:ShlB/FhaC/HecB family hemolysin secretion/activation protein [Caulobacter sp. S45]|uniref:ShlB/FhaC/HecB family hemolysin secretion/activation protein n=1 Tax=Caulobacter sp. S45 TaxID=1641861 RepID=UPI0015756C8F|nr:ShlB/FhaC/HecB family hemolysin secretion/activation protein [Caulobacter sp. S45]